MDTRMVSDVPYGAGARSDYASACTLVELFESSAPTGSKTALVFPGERLTYQQLRDRSDAFAKSLSGLGVGMGDRIGLFLQESASVVALMLGILKIGAVVVPVNNRYKADELRHCILQAGVRYLITSSDGYVNYAELVEAALRPTDRAGIEERISDSPSLAGVVCFSGRAPEGFIGREAFDGAASEAGARPCGTADAQHPAFMIFTSGTTARPKAVVITHGHMRRVITVVPDDIWGIRPEDVIWMPLPLCHVGGIMYSFMSLCLGSTLCHCGHFEPGFALRQIEEERCTVALPAFDTIWLSVIDHPQFPEHDLGLLRHVTLVGVSANLRRAQRALPHAALVSAYGSTECVILATSRPDDPEDSRLATCGRPIPGMEVRIADPDTCVSLPVGSRGEVQYRGPSLFVGYYGDAAATVDSFSADGWFRSGDLAKLDSDGRLVFCGRLKDMIKVGGENVAAAEVEDILAMCGKVHMSAVVAAPDAKYSEVPAAYVELKEGETATEQEIIDFCRGKIASFKVPRYVRFIDEWPMSRTKIKKYELRERIASELRRCE